MESLIITDRYRTPVVAEQRTDGGVVRAAPANFIALNRAELDRLVSFVRDEPRLGTLQRFPVTSD